MQHDYQLDEFHNYKNQLIGDLLTNEEIVRLLDDDYQSGTPADSLVFSQVFPYEFIPDTVEHGQTFICCEVEISKTYDKTYLKPVIYVWVFAHKSKLRLPNGGLRIDNLASRISSVLNGSRMYGLGVLDLYSVKRFAPIDEYQGKVLTFDAKDFNRLSPSTKKVPSNRKKG